MILVLVAFERNIVRNFWKVKVQVNVNLTERK